MFPIRSSVTLREGRAPWLTGWLVLLNVLVFVYELALPPHALDAFLSAYGVVPAAQLEALRETPFDIASWLGPIATSAFLHGGWAHLIGNVLFLWVFGRALESRLGAARFAALYAAAAVFAAWAQVVASPASLIPMVGASGAIAGLMGAHLVLFPRARVTVLFPVLIFPLFFEVPAFLFLGVWFLEQLWAGALFALSPLAAQAGGVAFWAHVGGFVAGAIVVRSWARRARAAQAAFPRRPPPPARPAAFVDENGRLVRVVRF